MTPSPEGEQERHQHGVKGVYYGGDWLDIEECHGVFDPNIPNCSGNCIDAATAGPCPRSMSRPTPKATSTKVPVSDGADDVIYDVLIVGAGCIGATIARELSKYDCSVLWIESADDVSQGATKGNSGIVHAGYDDKPGTNRAKYCWKGNQMFAQLDKELRFGYQKNGSLVVAFNDKERDVLRDLLKRGETNGVRNLRILKRDELLAMEPHINPKAVAALYSPDAGNVIPYEFTIALGENAVDNGVVLRIRRELYDIKSSADNTHFICKLNYWEPATYIHAVKGAGKKHLYNGCLLVGGAMVFVHYLFARAGLAASPGNGRYHMIIMVVMYIVLKLNRRYGVVTITRETPIADLVERAGKAIGSKLEDQAFGSMFGELFMEIIAGGGNAAASGTVEHKVNVNDMMTGGSGAASAMKGQSILKEQVKARYIINCAGGNSDFVARLIGDESFTIKPRIGDYLLLNRNQGHLANHTIFPCPDPVLGKGVLVQTTLWGNLILGPTARDVYQAEARDMSPEAIQEYILTKCKKLVPDFDAKEVIHAFAGARAKSDRGDWIIGPSKKNKKMIHVAGIDSPGLAGSPAIAVDVVKMLMNAGLKMKKDPTFNPNRAPIITPKDGMKGLKMGPVGKFDSDGKDETQMAQNVICKCEKVTELEVVRALRRSLPIDSSQAIRKRTRAGMGHCQADPANYNCEARVRAIIARENGTPIDQVGGRPWPATSTLPERWLNDEEKAKLAERMAAE